MNKSFIIILYVVEGSEKFFTFCMISIFRKRFRTEWFRKFVFNFNLTGVYLVVNPEDRVSRDVAHFQMVCQFIAVHQSSTV